MRRVDAARGGEAVPLPPLCRGRPGRRPGGRPAPYRRRTAARRRWREDRHAAVAGLRLRCAGRSADRHRRRAAFRRRQSAARQWRRDRVACRRQPRPAGPGRAADPQRRPGMATGRQGPAASRRRPARQGGGQGRHHRAARPAGDPRSLVPRRRDGAAARRRRGTGAPARRRAAPAARAHPGARVLSRGQPIAVLPRSQAVLVHRQQSDADEAHAGQHRRGRRDDDRPRRRQGRPRLCARSW